MTQEDVLATLRAAAAEVLGVDEASITPDASFQEDLGADSLDLVDLMMVMEDRLGIDTIPENQLKGITTVQDALDLMVALLAAAA